MNRTLTAALVALLPALAAAQDQPKPLTVGDPAPALKVGQWIKGEPITALGNGRVTVLDFWATWCGPCIAAIPHMSELQAKYADQQVDVIGVSIWERSQAGVVPFVEGRDKNETQGDEMAYRVARDDVPPLPEGVQDGSRDAQVHAAKGTMAHTWMDAAGRSGIPTVFIVDRAGRIAWIGHPMDGMDEALAQVVAGTFDLEAAKQAAERAARAQQVAGVFAEKLAQGDLAGAQALARERLADTFWEDARALNWIAWEIVDPKSLLEGERDLGLALKAAERANELMEGKDASTLDTLARVHFTGGDVDRALALQRSAVEQSSGKMKLALEEVLKEYEAARQAGGGTR